MITHPYIKYGIALIMEKKSLHNQNEICLKDIVDEIQDGLNTFRLKPCCNWEGHKEIRYTYTNEDGRASDYIFLSPHVVTTDMQARKTKNAALNYINQSEEADTEFLSKGEKIGMSEVPIVGEFASFSNKIGRGSAKTTKMIQGLGLVTTLTQYKPSISNACIIPDLDVPDMILFIRIFKRILFVETDKLFIGDVKLERDKYVPKRPKIQNGNFPNAPLSNSLGSIALLATIGDMGKKADYSDVVKYILDKLKDVAFYIIKYGDAKSFRFNHYIIDLAKAAKLSSVVDSFYYSYLYNQDKRSWNNTEYQKFDMFASRFLQLFSKPSFKDFLSFRAEYPYQIELLLTTYFNKMEKINKSIIESVKCLGLWLNRVAYQSATEDKETKLDLRQKKAKILIELESSIFAAKSADALISQTLTRAGRLSCSDAPAESSLFIEETLAGNIELNVAKNMLIAFSRIKNVKKNAEDETNEIPIEEPDIDYSNI